MTDNKKTEIDFLKNQLILKNYDEVELRKLEIPDLIREYAHRLIEVLTFKSLVTSNNDTLKTSLIQKLQSKNVSEMFNIDMADVTTLLSTESAEQQQSADQQQSATKPSDVTATAEIGRAHV